MKQTRVEKYKDYRSKLSTSNAPTLNNHYVNNDFRDTLSTTTTLPISEVYSSLDNDKNEKEEMLKLEEEIRTLTEENKTLTEKVKLAQADLVNYRKRKDEETGRVFGGHC